MSYGSTRHSESPGSRRSMDGDTTEDGGDDRDETKRRSRNLSEKKRRDQFNILVNELCTMVSTSPRKMDKSTVLKATIAFLKAHNELAVQSQVQETQEDWKPSFLSNEEFTHLMLEVLYSHYVALDGFIIVISSSGKILYVSESITSLLGYLSSEMVSGGNTIYDFVQSEERNDLYGVLSNLGDEKFKSQVSMVLNFRVGGLETDEENQKYQLIKLIGDSKSNMDKSEGEMSESSNSGSGSESVLIATGRLLVCDLLREMSVVVDSEKNEFSSRHSLEWKFLFLDHRAPPIIGYLPFEVLGTSGYDYYHVEDLEKVATCHEALMQRGEGTSCYYRFLTKGQQWIWLQTRFYITYHQWNSKPEFIVCTHRVVWLVDYAEVMKKLLGDAPVVSFDENSSAARLGPSLPKQPKLEKGHSSLKSSSRHKNGSLSYGSLGSKRSSGTRKLELPPKFALALSSAHPILVHSQGHSSPIQMPQVMSIADTLMSSSNVAVALHPQVSQLVHPSHQPTLTNTTVPRLIGTSATVALPVATYNSLPQTPALSIASTVPIQASQMGISMPQSIVVGHPVIASQPCVLQDQLLKKHAELQRQILQQQEELRRVSEQLLMSQCSWIQTDSIILPQNHNHSVHLQPHDENAPHQQCQQPLMAYSPHPASHLPAAPTSSTNSESGHT
ncbi:Circadian locomoter output cycles protein kaput, partial [Orchesella cincta]